MQTQCLSIAKIRFFHDKHHVSNKKTRCIIFLGFIFVYLQTKCKMRKTFFIIIWLFVCFAHAQNVDLKTLRNIGLPVVVVETIDEEEPSCEYLTPEDGYPGYSIRNATKVPSCRCACDPSTQSSAPRICSAEALPIVPVAPCPCRKTS